MDKVKQQIIERIKQANNVLVTVSNNPSVDQLAACIGLTLMLNKLGKHGTAVFSGEVPSTIEFLQPEKTLEKDTNSLRDFIIALDKSKADKLRYKVEDKVVKIFITPYKTSISEKDLQFSEGDFNVDVVVALGVHNQTEVDQAIAAHGRILHDATVISINDKANGNLGTLNLMDSSASGLSELIAGLDGQIGKPILDNQIATALLTGIVAQTDRFSNNKTSSQTMAVSAKLMAAGANQQLVATKLAPPPPSSHQLPAEPKDTGVSVNKVTEPPKKPDDGTLTIDHGNKPTADSANPESDSEDGTQIHIDEEGNFITADQNQTPVTAPSPTPEELSVDTPLPTAKTDSQPPASAVPAAPAASETPMAPAKDNGVNVSGGTPLMTQPPTWNSQLTANTAIDSYELGKEASTDPLSLPPQPKPPSIIKDGEGGLKDHKKADNLNLKDARSAVNEAMLTSSQPLSPRIDLNAQPVFDGLQPADRDGASGALPSPATQQTNDPLSQSVGMPMPSTTSGGLYSDTPNGEDDDVASGAPPPNDNFQSGSAPPPVPPPMVPPVF